MIQQQKTVAIIGGLALMVVVNVLYQLSEGSKQHAGMGTELSSIRSELQRLSLEVQVTKPDPVPASPQTSKPLSTPLFSSIKVHTCDFPREHTFVYNGKTAQHQIRSTGKLCVVTPPTAVAVVCSFHRLGSQPVTFDVETERFIVHTGGQSGEFEMACQSWSGGVQGKQSFRAVIDIQSPPLDVTSGDICAYAFGLYSDPRLKSRHAMLNTTSAAAKISMNLVEAEGGKNLPFPCLKSPGYTGMWLSMLKVWRRALVSCPQDWIAVFEDDAAIPSSFLQTFRKLRELDAGSAVSQEHQAQVYWLDERAGPNGPNPSGCCTVGMAYHKSALPTLISQFNPENENAYWVGYEDPDRKFPVVGHSDGFTHCLTDYYLGNMVAAYSIPARVFGFVRHPSKSAVPSAIALLSNSFTGDVGLEPIKPKKYPLGLDFDLSACKYLYLDVGSNIGVQVRKLFEPSLYADAPMTQYLAKEFPESNNMQKASVCALGFEANQKHAPRLRKLQTCYGTFFSQNVHFFTPRAVSTTSDTMISIGSSPAETSGKGASDWAAGEFDDFYKGQGIKVDRVDVRSIDLVDVLKHAGNAKVIMKLDIEGTEWKVVPHLIKHGMLCEDKIHSAMIEWHGWAPHTIDETEIHRQLNSQKCNPTKLINLDDETYLTDGQPLPVPCRDTDDLFRDMKQAGFGNDG